MTMFALKGGSGGGSHPAPAAPHPSPPTHVTVASPPQVIHHYVPIPVPGYRPHPYIPGLYHPFYHPWYHPVYVWPSYGNYSAGNVSALETVLVILLIAAIIGGIVFGTRRWL